MSIDDNTLNEDWLKTFTWDIRCDNELVENLAQLFAALGVVDQPRAVQSKVLLNFLKLPAAQAMPNPLRAEIRKWLRR